MLEFEGKKLLVIGGSNNDINIVEAAHDLGCYVICCDRNTDYKTKAQAKLICDEAWDVDYSHTEHMIELCKEAKIDGIFAGYNDFRVQHAAILAERLGLPFYATAEQIEITKNKQTFKELAIKYGINTPKSTCYVGEVPEEARDQVKYPVIVKPVDNGGRRGITACFNRQELDKAIAYAFKSSVSKTIIIEDYIVGTEFAAIYTVSEGKASLSIINDKHLAILEDGSVTTLSNVGITPSKYYDLYVQTIDGPVRDFIRGVGIRHGVVFFQGIANDKEIQVFEMGFRLNGANDYKAIRRQNGTDYMKMMITQSLTGSMGDDLKNDDARFKIQMATFCMYVHGGTVGHVDCSILDNLKGVASYNIWAEPGRVISEDGTTLQRAVIAKLEADSIQEMAELIEKIQTNVVFRDENGNNMLFPPFDTKRLTEQ